MSEVIGKFKTEQEARTLYDNTQDRVAIILSREWEQERYVNYYYVETGVPLIRIWVILCGFSRHERLIDDKDDSPSSDFF